MHFNREFHIDIDIFKSVLSIFLLLRVNVFLTKKAYEIEI